MTELTTLHRGAKTFMRR